MSKTTLSRRATLRGLLGGSLIRLGLPPLEMMFNSHGTAYAAGDAPPKRFGVWYWADGVGTDAFFPSQTGTAWEPTEFLEPLRDVKAHVSLVSGLTFNHFSRTVSHHWNRAAVLSNSVSDSIYDLVDQKGYSAPALPSIDQVVAKAWTGRTKFDSVEISIATAGVWPRTSSWKAAKNRMPGEIDPRRLFSRLFTGVMPSGSSMATPDPGADALATALERERLMKKSVLDVAMEDAKDLTKRLGASDKRRLDAHWDALRAIEMRLDAPSSVPGSNGDVVTPVAQCDPSGIAGVDRDYGQDDANLSVRNKIMVDILVAALACDRTRVFNFELSGTQSHVVYKEAGCTSEHHPMTHGEVGNRGVEYPKSTKFVMAQLAYFVKRLAETREGAGSLIDNVCVYTTSENRIGGAHTTENLPMLVVGGAGVKKGTHVHTSGKGGKAMLTLLRAVGVDQAEYGDGEGRTSETIPELLA